MRTRTPIPLHGLARLSLVLLWLVLSAASAPVAAADEPPAPDFARVDHADPALHLALSPEVGDAAKIRSLASQLKVDDSQEATLTSIYQWMHRNLRYDERAAYAWRSLDEMLAARTVGGCADHAAVFGTLARAAGIPAIWVKTLDVDWIHEFRAAPQAVKSWRGHVFLEVYLGGAWRLLDASAMRLYPAYDVRTRMLPGQRLAYDKGDDPFDLVLSCRWELWKEQTRRYVLALDDAVLPWSTSQDLLAAWRVWIAGNSPLYRYATDACGRLGYHVRKSFNDGWETWLPQARGGILIVTCQGTKPVLPEPLWGTWLPPAGQAFARGGPPPENGFLHHRLADGTTVILVTGQDSTAVQTQVAKALAAARR